MKYQVGVLKVGEVNVPGPEVFWMSDWERWLPLSINVVVIQGEGTTALVNTGAPEDLSPINEMWTAVPGERGRYRRTAEQEFLPQLAGMGIRPDEVTHVIVTPLQLYSTAGIPHFPRAQICLSERGWIHFHTTHSHPHDSRWHSISKEVLTYLVTTAWDRVRLLKDEDTIVNGIRTWWAGNHHRASVAVEIDTPSGIVVASDAFFYHENVENDRPLGISENLCEGMTCFERTRRTANYILPLYDPRIFDRYPGGVIGAVARA
jgi:hypothetical protein